MQRRTHREAERALAGGDQKVRRFTSFSWCHSTNSRSEGPETCGSLARSLSPRSSRCSSRSPRSARPRREPAFFFVEASALLGVPRCRGRVVRQDGQRCVHHAPQVRLQRGPPFARRAQPTAVSRLVPHTGAASTLSWACASIFATIASSGAFFIGSEMVEVSSRNRGLTA